MHHLSPTKTLLLAAESEFESAIVPLLAGRQRYSGAMIKRTLGVLRRQMNAPPEHSERVLLTAVYGSAEDCTLRDLAADIRARRIDTTPNRVDAFISYIESKLAISNPAFLGRKT